MTSIYATEGDEPVSKGGEPVSERGEPNDADVVTEVLTNSSYNSTKNYSLIPTKENPAVTTHAHDPIAFHGKNKLREKAYELSALGYGVNSVAKMLHLRLDELGQVMKHDA